MPEFTWTGDDFFDGARAQVTQNVGDAGQALKAAMQANIATQGPPRSLPGDSPHRDHGALYASIEANGPIEQGDAVYSNVGTSLPYGIWLETGTRRMAARPYQVKSLRENQDALGQIILHGGGTTE